MKKIFEKDLKKKKKEREREGERRPPPKPSFKVGHFDKSPFGSLGESIKVLVCLKAYMHTSVP